MEKIKIFSLNPAISGIKFIIDNLIEQFLIQRKIEVIVISELSSLHKSDIIIPYGAKETFLLYKHFYFPKAVLLIDSQSAICKDLFLHYLKKRKIRYQIFRMFFSYFFYLILEFFLLKTAKLVVLVSEYDRDYFNNLYFSNFKNILVVKNGIKTNDIILKPGHEIDPSRIRFGIISNWSSTAFEDARWFIDDIFDKLLPLFSNIQLIIAGKGASLEMIKYFKGKKNIIFLNEVNHVSEFYNQIDFFICTVIKKSGILNKVLESFAYKKVVIGMPHHFVPFSSLENGYIIYLDLDELITIIRNIESHDIDYKKTAENAFEYVLKYHNWSVNYNILVQKILQIL